MDMCLLWLPYPLMLANRGLCGFLGNNSVILRESAVQTCIPAHLRSRVNAFCEALMMAAGSLLAVAVGALGELLDYRWCVTVCAGTSMLACWLFIWGGRRDVRRIYERKSDAAA